MILANSPSRLLRILLKIFFEQEIFGQSFCFENLMGNSHFPRYSRILLMHSIVIGQRPSLVSIGGGLYIVGPGVGVTFPFPLVSCGLFPFPLGSVGLLPFPSVPGRLFPLPSVPDGLFPFPSVPGRLFPLPSVPGGLFPLPSPFGTSDLREQCFASMPKTSALLFMRYLMLFKKSFCLHSLEHITSIFTFTGFFSFVSQLQSFVSHLHAKFSKFGHFPGCVAHFDRQQPDLFAISKHSSNILFWSQIPNADSTARALVSSPPLSISFTSPGSLPEELPGSLPEELPGSLPEELPGSLPDELPGSLPEELPEGSLPFESAFL